MTQWARGPKCENVSSNWCFVFSHVRQPGSLDGALQPSCPAAVLCVLPQAIGYVVGGVGIAFKRQGARGTQHLTCRTQYVHAAATAPLRRAELVDENHLPNRLELLATDHDGDATALAVPPTVCLAIRHDSPWVKSNQSHHGLLCTPFKQTYKGPRARGLERTQVKAREGQWCLWSCRVRVTAMAHSRYLDLGPRLHNHPAGESQTNTHVPLPSPSWSLLVLAPGISLGATPGGKPPGCHTL